MRSYPTLEVDEVGIPPEIAKELTVQQRVYSLNINHFTNLLNEGKINSIIRGGKRIYNMKGDQEKEQTQEAIHFCLEVCYRRRRLINPQMVEYSKAKVFELLESDRILRGGESFVSLRRKEEHWYVSNY